MYIHKIYIYIKYIYIYIKYICIYIKYIYIYNTYTKDFTYIVLVLCFGCWITIIPLIHDYIIMLQHG